MNNSNKYPESYEKEIHNYIQGKMSVAETKAFEATIATDKSLEEAVNFQKQIKIVYENKATIDYYSDLKERTKDIKIESYSAGTSENTWFSGKSLFLSLGTVAILALLGWWLMKGATISHPLHDLSQEYLVPFEQVVSTGSDTKSQLYKGLIAYENNDYNKAIIALKASEQKDGKDKYTSFYLALSHLMNQDAQQALPILANLLRLNDPTYNDDFKWYTVLTYLLLEDETNAKLLLLELEDSKKYRDKARELTARINASFL